MSKHSHVPVVIVGAGPTGVMLAIELARRGIDAEDLGYRGDRPQNPAAFSFQQIAGNFASGFSGVDSSLNRLAGAGAYTIDQTGKVTGTIDSNENGVFVQQRANCRHLVCPRFNDRARDRYVCYQRSLDPRGILRHVCQ